MQRRRRRRVGLEAVITYEAFSVAPAGEVVGPAGVGVVGAVAAEEPGRARCVVGDRRADAGDVDGLIPGGFAEGTVSVALDDAALVVGKRAGRAAAVGDEVRGAGTVGLRFHPQPGDVAPRRRAGWRRLLLDRLGVAGGV